MDTQSIRNAHGAGSTQGIHRAHVAGPVGKGREQDAVSFGPFLAVEKNDSRTNSLPTKKHWIP
jgi:hypothetical protein